MKQARAGRNGMRRRVYRGHPFFSAGFRPFFFCGAIFAGLALPLWILFLEGYVHPEIWAFDPLYWHAHEMLFGYLGAVIGGFILTAIPNWTGRLPVMGVPLAGLLALWIAGRLGILMEATGLISPIPAMGLDLLYPVALVAVVLREVIFGRNWRNLPIVAFVALFGFANLFFHLAILLDGDPMTSIRLALAVSALLISLIGGRVTPSFTRNWLAKTIGAPFPAPFGQIDRLALFLTGASVLSWAFFPDARSTGLLLLAAGVVQIVRLSRWRGIRTTKEPLVTILHVGYGWLTLSFLAIGAAILFPEVINASAGLHALTAGAIGTMTLAVMTRATLGHTGRTLAADRATIVIYGLVTAGAVLRVTAYLLPVDYLHAVAMAGTLWSAAFLIFAWRYGTYLMGEKL